MPLNVVENLKMKFSFRRRKSSTKSKSESQHGATGVSGVKARIQLRLLSQLKWEAYCPKKLKGEKPGKGAGRQEPLAVAKDLWSGLDTFQGCTDFLQSSGLNTRALRHAARMVDHFKSSYQIEDSSLSNEFRIAACKETLRQIAKSLVDQTLASNPRLESYCIGNEENMSQLRSACETWVLGSVYEKVLGACKLMFGQSDKILDYNLARLDKVDPIVLGVRSEFKDFVLGEALLQFRMINRGRTPLEKAICLQKTINCIIEGIQTVISSCSGTTAEKDGLLPCTDDLLSFMLLLMARSRVKNLQANACYMDNFLSLQAENEQSGELAYHVTNFMAACNYLNSLEVEKLVASVSAPSTAEKIPASLKSPRSVASSPVRVAPIYSTSHSFEPDVHSMNGEIFIVDMFDGRVSGRHMSQSEMELRSISEKCLGQSGLRESSKSRGGSLHVPFP